MSVVPDFGCGGQHEQVDIVISKNQALQILYLKNCVSLGTLVPNSRDRQGKLWLPKKQKTALKTTLQ